MKALLSVIVLSLTLNSFLFAAPKFIESSSNSCFKTREVPYGLDETFDALKQTLLHSNLNIVTVTKKDGVLTAKGTQFNDEAETILSLTLSVDFKSREEGTTSVRVIASYETREKKQDLGQVGAAGISLPIPVPFSGSYLLAGQGNIEDSNWYIGFFNSLNKILFENHMKYAVK